MINPLSQDIREKVEETPHAKERMSVLEKEKEKEHCMRKNACQWWSKERKE
jgi:hypothetical protein